MRKPDREIKVEDGEVVVIRRMPHVEQFDRLSPDEAEEYANEVLAAVAEARKPALKPCPLCLSTNVRMVQSLRHPGNVVPECSLCWMCGPTGLNDDQAVEKWNALPRPYEPTGDDDWR